MLKANDPTIIRADIEGSNLSMTFAVNDDGMISALLFEGTYVVAEEYSNGTGRGNDRLAHTVLEWILDGS